MSSSTASRGSGGRRRVNSRRVLDLASHLTERDLEILTTLFEHQILTTDQLALLFFSSTRRAQDRPLFLHDNSLVDRFYPPRPFRHGKPHAHWLLDEHGAILVAARLGVERKKLGWERRDDWGSHPQLAHRLEVNRFVTGLIAATLPDPSLGVTDWWGQSHSRHAVPDPDIAVPDAFFRFVSSAGAVDCLLEWDRGTESGRVLADKLYRYRVACRRAREGERFCVLFVVPSERRVTTLYAAMRAADERRNQWDDTGRAWDWPILLCTAEEIRRHGPLARLWRRADDERSFPLPITDLPPRTPEPPIGPQDALGRLWHKDRPDFWHALCPLGAARPSEEDWR